METKNLAKGNGRLFYFGSNSENLDDSHTITRDDTINVCIFFRAKNTESIIDNIVSIKKDCVGDTPLNEIPMGKKVKFIAGDPIKFEGIAIGVVRIGRYKYLEIEIIPNELYFYSWLDDYSECSLLRVVS